MKPSLSSLVKWCLRILGLAAAVALIAVITLDLLPDRFASEPDCKPGDANFGQCLDLAKARADDRRAVSTAILAILAGTLSALGVIITWRTLELNRRTARQSHELDRAGQITERFTRAVDQLGSDKSDVALGGIYALERIAHDSKADRPQIVEVLTAYVRSHALWPDQSKRATRAPAVRVSIDVQAAVSVLGRRHASRRERGPLDLRQCYLRGLTLEGEDATGTAADLKGADLGGADLRDAYLDRANLEGARLVEADLRGAQRRFAHLREAGLSSAVLDGALLEGAELANADLSGADLRNVDLGGADLRGAELSGALLQGAVLADANLDGAQLGDATYDGETQWPDGFDASASGAQLADHE